MRTWKPNYRVLVHYSCYLKPPCYVMTGTNHNRTLNGNKCEYFETRAISVPCENCDQFARIRQAWQNRALQLVATLQSAVFVETLVLYARNSLLAVLSDPRYCSKHDSELSIRFQVTELAEKAVGCFLCTFIIRTPPGLRSLSGWCRGFETCCYSLVRCSSVLSYDGGGLTIGWPTWHSLKLIRRWNMPLPNLWTQKFGTGLPVLGVGRPRNCGSIRGRVRIFFCASNIPNHFRGLISSLYRE